MGPAEGFFFFNFILFFELGASPCAPHASWQPRLTTEAALGVGIAPLHGRCCHCFLPKCIYYRINTITGSSLRSLKEEKTLQEKFSEPIFEMTLFSSLLWWWLNFTFFNKYNFVVYIHISVCIYMHIHVPNRKRRGWLFFSVSVNQFCFV